MTCRLGLTAPDDARTRRWLLLEAKDDAERGAITYEHWQKVLARAEQAHRALDAPAMPPDHLRLIWYAGDVDQTPDVLAVDPDTDE